MAGTLRLPTLHKPLDRAIGTLIPLDLESFKETLGRASLTPRSAGLDLQPLLSLGLVLTQFRHGLMLSLVDRIRQYGQRFANRGTRAPKLAGNRTDALPVNQMTPSDIGNEFHPDHPRLLRLKSRQVARLRGGKNSMLISPDPWEVFHVD
ncbi:hypothetical protein [Thiocystis minor]|uniref:hypothetical protein n=1 Tax=Thiocystis minor TaxID=61597 RepID=UPI0019142F11|nr:hypothetical protein [Thiocystis minor]